MIVLGIDGGRYQLAEGEWQGPNPKTVALLESTRELWPFDVDATTGALPTPASRDLAWARWVVAHLGGALLQADPIPDDDEPTPPGVVY